MTIITYIINSFERRITLDLLVEVIAYTSLDNWQHFLHLFLCIVVVVLVVVDGEVDDQTDNYQENYERAYNAHDHFAGALTATKNELKSEKLIIRTKFSDSSWNDWL